MTMLAGLMRSKLYLVIARPVSDVKGAVGCLVKQYCSETWTMGVFSNRYLGELILQAIRRAIRLGKQIEGSFGWVIMLGF